MELKPFKVSEITQYIKRILIRDPILYDVSIEGEVSNFKLHYNGNMYFTLKDDKSKIRCVCFNNMDTSTFIPEDGMCVIVSGYISIYERDGTYQLYVSEIKEKGLGELYEAFEKLKKKLEKEGLFDVEKKRPLKFLPKKIGVATSSTGAAIRDIISVVKRRMPTVDIIIYPVLVQGQKSPDEICKALEYFNNRDDIDLIIIGRGGGSIEELWAFNDERVARAIFDSKIPVISAVGHETDFTISDFVADMRAPTPSVAGELAVPKIDDLNYRLNSILQSMIEYMNSLLNANGNKLESVYHRLMLYNPVNTLNESKQRLDIIFKDLVRTITQGNLSRTSKLELLGNKLNSLSPLSVLNRGYSVVKDKNGHIIKSAKDVSIDEYLDLILCDGEIEVKVTRNNNTESR